MKAFNTVRKFGSRVAVAAAGLAVAAGSAHAAVPAEITTAMTDLKADVGTIGVAVLLAIVAMFTLKMIRRAL